MDRVRETEAYLNPHKIMTSYKLEGPVGTAEIHLTRLDTGEIEVTMTLWKETVEPTVTVHKTYGRAIDRAAEHAFKLVGKRVIG